jgi:hypothetical protein
VYIAEKSPELHYNHFIKIEVSTRAIRFRSVC